MVAFGRPCGKRRIAPMKATKSSISVYSLRQMDGTLHRSSAAFVFAVSVNCRVGVTGPIFGFSDTWQLVINTGTTIVTFLMVFLIQNTSRIGIPKPYKSSWMN